jgi:hypothetical protein
MGVTVVVPWSRISILVRVCMHHCPVWVTLHNSGKQLWIKSVNGKEIRNW